MVAGLDRVRSQLIQTTFVTAGATEERRRTLAAGFDAHLVKPVDPDVLSRALATDFRTAA